MEGLVANPEFWAKRKVFITGHTGFKGAWLSQWLTQINAAVSGYALAPATNPNLFSVLNLALANDIRDDIRNAEDLAQAIHDCSPEVIFHMAAQPLVRASYHDPVGTFATNVMGTAHLLEAARRCPSVKVIVVITTDKCYENREWVWPYREDDPLGGHDPYSSSKAGTELVAQSYRRSFFAQEGKVRLATARAGNVIGGGDWSDDRLIPDMMRGLSEQNAIHIRNPAAIRPWQHVLDPLNGYLLLAERLWRGETASGAWNFGPHSQDCCSVADICKLIGSHWPEANQLITSAIGKQPHEANVLKLDSTKANSLLGWLPRWRLAQSVAATVKWYHAYYTGEDIIQLTQQQIQQFQQGHAP